MWQWITLGKCGLRSGQVLVGSIHTRIPGPKSVCICPFTRCAKLSPTGIVPVYIPTDEMWGQLCPHPWHLIFQPLNTSACFTLHCLIMNEGEHPSYVLESSASMSIYFLEFWENIWLSAGSWLKLKAGRTRCSQPPARTGEWMCKRVNGLSWVGSVGSAGSTESKPN